MIDPAQCTACGACAEVCRFEAVVASGEAYRVDALACEGCAAFCAERGVDVVGRIPYDTVVTEAMEGIWKPIKGWAFSI